jgi:hypothetical protein
MFTIGVFQDAAWADRGIAALLNDGFAAESLSLIAKQTDEVESITRSRFDEAPTSLEIGRLGRAIARGPIVPVLQGRDSGLQTAGVGATIGRAGFQRHDGHIYETLLERGGVLVAIHNFPRAADALAKLHAYGGGNAAIGAWAGRVREEQSR